MAKQGIGIICEMVNWGMLACFVKNIDIYKEKLRKVRKVLLLLMLVAFYLSNTI